MLCICNKIKKKFNSKKNDEYRENETLTSKNIPYRQRQTMAFYRNLIFLVLKT